MVLNWHSSYVYLIKLIGLFLGHLCVTNKNGLFQIYNSLLILLLENMHFNKVINRKNIYLRKSLVLYLPCLNYLSDFYPIFSSVVSLWANSWVFLPLHSNSQYKMVSYSSKNTLFGLLLLIAVSSYSTFNISRLRFSISPVACT